MTGSIRCLKHWHIVVFYLGMMVAVAVFMAGCSSNNDADTVEIMRTVDDGSPTSPIANTLCRFVDLNNWGTDRHVKAHFCARRQVSSAGISAASPVRRIRHGASHGVRLSLAIQPDAVAKPDWVRRRCTISTIRRQARIITNERAVVTVPRA